MAEIRIVRDYPQPPEQVWRALTDPALIPRWTSTGAGGRPEGFATTVGARFRYVAKSRPGWSGIVECVVLESDEPRLLRYSWADPGVGGLFMATLLRRVRAKMLTTGLPAVLNDMS